MFTKHPLLNPKDTIVISDFDGTLTKKVVNDQPMPSLLSLLVNEKYLGMTGTKTAQDLFNHYYPIELDPAIPESEKQIQMAEWWRKSVQVLIDQQVTLTMIHEITTLPQVQFRDGALEFLDFLAKNQTQLIIYSASGIGTDAITYLLQTHQLLTPNITIVSNDLDFDEQGRVVAIRQPLIHIANKIGSTLISAQAIIKHPLQGAGLVIGDSLDDAKMAQGLEFDLVYKVAFGNHHPEHFEPLFDQVLPITAGFQPILQLFQA